MVDNWVVSVVFSDVTDRQNDIDQTEENRQLRCEALWRLEIARKPEGGDLGYLNLGMTKADLKETEIHPRVKFRFARCEMIFLNTLPRS